METTTTSLVFDGRYYSAYIMQDGSLVITSKHRQGGVRLVDGDAETWIEAIRTAVDADEASSLCRALIK